MAVLVEELKDGYGWAVEAVEEDQLKGRQH